ncbi:MAG: MFS transporter [Bacteroidales bacterium]|nr:MFS transporter [Bacteroidales bacterium]
MKKSLSVFAVFLVFLAMGFGDAANQLVSIVQEAFHVTPFTASFVSLFGMIMFGILSVPTGVMQSKIGKKKMLVIGLIVFLLGAILPALAFSFPMILAAVMLMGAGATILQVAGNPLMKDVSAEGKYSSNLSFAQSVKAIGTLSTSLIIALVGTSLMKHSWFRIENINAGSEPINAGFRILFPIFAAILLITLIMVTIYVPNNKNSDEKPTTVGKCIAALGNSYILMMFFGIFFYCGAEASMFGRIPSILSENVNIAPSTGNIVLIIALFIGRFLGGIILRKMKPNTFLFITIAVSAIGNILLFMPYNPVTTWLSFILVGIGFANIFPLIFSMCIERYPKLSNEISGLMTTAIVGAAFVPLLTGLAANANPRYAFIVTLACLAYITFVAIRNTKKANN